MKHLKEISVMFMATILLAGCQPESKELKLTKFIDKHVARVKPLAKELNLAYWQAANSGKEEDYDKSSSLELKIRKIYSNKGDFAFLKNMKESGQIKDQLLSRQLLVLYNSYLPNQIEPKLTKQLVELGTQIEKNFSTFRGKIGVQELSDNQIREILKTETNSAKRKEAWEASKQVGEVVAKDLIKLVKLRNEAARKVGFDNFHTMRLTLGQQDVKEVDKIFQELYELTNDPFAKVKLDLDEILSEKYRLDIMGVMPWHYHDPFFQETPLVLEVNLDKYYEGKDVVKLAREFFYGIDLPADTIIARSDLFEREDKNPHAFSSDIDKEGDVRILCNVKNNEQWMETLLHELGHAVYDKNHDPKVPYILREPAHSFTTEAIAMMFGRQSRNAGWMQEMLGLSASQKTEIEKVCSQYAKMKQLIFARWAMVMYEFEKQLYANPDQDLNGLWWDLVDKYQLVNKPAGRNKPDWAAKIHFTIAPCYYHNYAMGELLASQLDNYISRNILKEENPSYAGEKKIGSFLKARVFEPSAVYYWNHMIERATGEKLTAKYFVEQFVK